MVDFRENIILIGFMGCGKSSVGKKLAYALSYEFVDTDDLIEQKAGESIPEIFKRIGEQGFRILESQIVQELLFLDNKTVISTGGGLPLREENRKILQKIGCIFFLMASPDTIYQRVKSDEPRPLLAVEHPKERISELLAERTCHYEATADMVIDTNHQSYGQIIQQIEEQLRKRQHERKVNMKILVINGPNLNFLGIREKDIYGVQDYAYLLRLLKEKEEKENIEIEVFQSNVEGEIINCIQRAYLEPMEAIVINPGAFTHYSYAIRDALASITVPIIEVHISNVHKREEFRHKSITATVCLGQITGLGLQGYLLAIDAILAINGAKIL